VNKKLIAESTIPTLNLTIAIFGLDPDVPERVDDTEALLTAHVVDCTHCLAMALYRDEALAEIGCEEYRSLLRK
jgi:hypothetical protein